MSESKLAKRSPLEFFYSRSSGLVVECEVYDESWTIPSTFHTAALLKLEPIENIFLVQGIPGQNRGEGGEYPVSNIAR